ncbi:hypothetical protein CSB93_3882 [Pseudomonas paraeruginosa]|uniref:Uncharacterized protein n=1 Tax=Pseudomonas paraeruginosa TaxID=2994495 RepID=A0A2R3IWQ6_9PSED|nr:hypothetical protein CSB93_3882 [Pseudomonas paraeruginosa]AWE94678.1 hypothetical protein CSC28_2666 [Pseudomonas paraeruginosa]
MQARRGGFDGAVEQRLEDQPVPSASCRMRPTFIGIRDGRMIAAMRALPGPPGRWFTSVRGIQ